LLLCTGFIPLIFAQEESRPVEEVLPRTEEQSENPYFERERDFRFNFEDTAGDNQSDGQLGGPTFGSVFRMILALALCAAAIYGIVFFIRKSSKKTDVKDPFLKILASAHLGSNRYAHVISVGSKAWLLGSSDGGVTLIGEVEDSDVINAMMLEEAQRSEEASTGRLGDFVSMLRRFGLPAKHTTSSSGDIRKRRERLKEF
jgi:flagellar protein FliO/FliZ